MTKALTFPPDHLVSRLRDDHGPVRERMNEAADAIEAAIAVHTRMAYWTHEDEMVDDNGEETEPEGYVCLHCSDDGVEEDLENWELDLTAAGTISWPCLTVQALGFGGTSSGSGAS